VQDDGETRARRRKVGPLTGPCGRVTMELRLPADPINAAAIGLDL